MKIRLLGVRVYQEVVQVSVHRGRGRKCIYLTYFGDRAESSFLHNNQQFAVNEELRGQYIHKENSIGGLSAHFSDQEEQVGVFLFCISPGSGPLLLSWSQGLGTPLGVVVSIFCACRTLSHFLFSTLFLSSSLLRLIPVSVPLRTPFPLPLLFPKLTFSFVLGFVFVYSAG